MFARRLLILRLLETIVRELSVSWRAETHTQAPTAPENTPQSESAPIKKQHGGKLAGTGRKPNLLKRIIGQLKPASAAEILAGVDVEAAIAEIMKRQPVSITRIGHQASILT